jgi:ABC-type glycerol-3-phosphate transport system substrate-binding protein
MKNLLTRWLPYLAVLVAIAVYTSEKWLSNSGHAEQARTVVTFWAFSYPAQTMLELKTQFEQTHPDIRVDVQTVPWEHLQQKTLWAIAANSNVPDVIVGSSEWLGGLVSAGALAPLDTSELGETFFQKYFPPALRIYQYPEVQSSSPSKGALRQYGIPLDIDLMVVYYRSDILDPLLEKKGWKSFPSTWDQFLELGKTVCTEFQTSQPPVRYLFLDPEDPVPLSMAFFPSSGTKVLDDRMEHAAFNCPAGISAFAFFARLLTEGCAMRWERGIMEDPLVLLKTTRSLVTVSGPWYRKVLERRIPEQAGRWRIALFPRREPQFPSSALGGACLAIPYNAPHKREALALIRFMAQEEFALNYFRRVGSPPPQISAWNDPVFSEPVAYFGGQRIYGVIREAIETAQPTQLIPNTQITRDCLRRALKNIADGASIQPTVEKAAKEIERLLQ